jgi:RING finger and SPRY domain-containing protein 1
MGPSVITLLLDDSPLPTKDSVIEVAEMIKTDTTTTIPCERNFCVILGCLAEKLAGPCSIAILTDTTLTYLLKNITEETPKDVMLFSLIALEKFAQTAENKSTIKRKLLSYPEHPLLRLEKYVDETKDLTMRQIGFCAQWSMDNYCESLRKSIRQHFLTQICFQS